MNTSVLYVALCLMIPVLLLLLYLEKRARRIMLSFSAGAFACLCAYYVNSFLASYVSADVTLLTVLVGPVCEELLKFIPVLIIALAVKKGKRGSTANAYAVGLGFCVVENIFYLLTEDDATCAWIVSRCISSGLMHGMSASILGIGIYYALHSKKHHALGIFLAFIAAVAYHSLFNFLVSGGLVMRIIGLIIPALTYVLIFVSVKKENIERFLNEEAEEK